MDHFSQTSEHSIMTQQIHARFNLSIITFITVREAEEITQHGTEHFNVNVIVGRS